MISEGYSASDITLDRNSLREDGWQISERLPNNWLLKCDKNGHKTKTLTFVSPDGTYYKSRESAVNYLKLQNLKEDASKLSKYVC